MSTIIAVVALIGVAISLSTSFNARSQVSEVRESLAHKADSSYVDYKISDLQQNDIAEKASRSELDKTNEAVSDLATSVSDLHSQLVNAEGVANGAYRTSVEAKKLAQTMEGRLVQANEQAVKRDNSTTANIKEIGRQVGDLMVKTTTTDQKVGDLMVKSTDQAKKINEVAARQDSLDAKLSDAEWFKKVLADTSPPKRKLRR
jgi:hypothetical protein